MVSPNGEPAVPAPHVKRREQQVVPVVGLGALVPHFFQRKFYLKEPQLAPCRRIEPELILCFDFKQQGKKGFTFFKAGLPKS